jgi:hypothetical protein
MDDASELVELNSRFIDAFRRGSSTRPGRFNRYVDTHARRDGRWMCVHASVWPLLVG